MSPTTHSTTHSRSGRPRILFASSGLIVVFSFLLETGLPVCAQSAATAVCLSVALWGQDSEGPNPLGDVARQTRADHASTSAEKSGKAQRLVDEMQQEQEAADDAPTGFKNYDAGEYRLLVPFPFTLEGRDDGGAVLMGSRLGITNTEVLAGTPVPIPPSLGENDLIRMANALASRNGSSGHCNATMLSTHKVFRCAWSGGPYLLGRQVVGSMVVVAASTSLIPVMCVSPDEMQCLSYSKTGYQTCDNPYPTWAEVQKTKAAISTRYRDELTTTQMCEQIIYPSIQLKEDIVVHPVSIPGKPLTEKKAIVTPVANQDGSVGSTPKESPLAELARQTRQASRQKPQATLDNTEGNPAPPGFQSFTLVYCPNLPCSEASVIVPQKTEVVSRNNGQYIFKTELDAESTMLYAGPADVSAPYRGMSDPDYIRIRDLAKTNGWSREQVDGVSTQDLDIQGKPALMTRFRYKRDQKRWWVGERALIGTGPTQFLLGCAAPEEHFADAEVLCTTLIDSLRLP